MFGGLDHLEMLLSIILSQPGNERFQFNWHDNLQASGF